MTIDLRAGKSVAPPSRATVRRPGATGCAKLAEQVPTCGRLPLASFTAMLPPGTKSDRVSADVEQEIAHSIPLMGHERLALPGLAGDQIDLDDALRPCPARRTRRPDGAVGVGRLEV